VKICVIVPTYHRDWELERALDSLGKQNFPEFRIVVVDDNVDSEWNAKVEEIIDRMKKSYPALTWIYIQNRTRMGSSMARNEGVRATEEEYITFLDDDDEYLPDKLSSQYSFMAANELDYSITNLDLYFDNGKLSESRDRHYIQKYDKTSLLEYHYMYHMTGTDTIMIRRDYFDRIGGFPPVNVGDEFYLMQKAIEAEGKFGYLDRCDVRAYVHTGKGGLSSGEGKIAGEKRIFAHKEKAFPSMSSKSVRYIRMRHYSVLAFAGLRMGNCWYVVKYGVLAFLSSPIQCLQMIQSRKKDTVA